MKKGVFWCKDFSSDMPTLIVIAVDCDEYGNALCPVEFSAKSGQNFNHQAEWQKLGKSITGRNPYNYYPRGRVEIKNKKVTVFLNADINREQIISLIKKEFELFDEQKLLSLTVKSDGSKHYQYIM